MMRYALIVSFGLLWAMQAFADFTSEEFFKILKNGDYVLISAGRNMNDPADKKLSDQVITARSRLLESKLKDAKFKFQKVIGKYNALEESFFISIHKDQEQFFQFLGEEFSQESIIIGSQGRQKMIYTFKKDKGLSYSGAGYKLVDEKQTDFYTELITTDGKKIRFSLNFDFDHKCVNQIQIYKNCQ